MLSESPQLTIVAFEIQIVVGVKRLSLAIDIILVAARCCACVPTSNNWCYMSVSVKEPSEEGASINLFHCAPKGDPKRRATQNNTNKSHSSNHFPGSPCSAPPLGDGEIGLGAVSRSEGRARSLWLLVVTIIIMIVIIIVLISICIFNNNNNNKTTTNNSNNTNSSAPHSGSATCVVREMGGAPRNPAPRNHLLDCQSIRLPQHRCTWWNNKIAECRPLLAGDVKTRLE